MRGLKLAACYSYPPSSLGFCGRRTRDASQVLHDFLGGKKIPLAQVRKTLAGFEALYPYLQLIARVNEIDDPFDYKVVEAYWLGNHLLDQVKPSDLRQLVLNDFFRPGLLPQKAARIKSGSIPPRAKPHHSFHVFVLGSITGRVKFNPRLWDLCRIGWGKVLRVPRGAGSCFAGKNSKLKVKSKPLLTGNSQFLLGKEIEKEIDWDKKLLPIVKVGETITFHWNFACQKISKKQEKNLLKYTKLNIQAINEQRK